MKIDFLTFEHVMVKFCLKVAIIQIRMFTMVKLANAKDLWKGKLYFLPSLFFICCILGLAEGFYLHMCMGL